MHILVECLAPTIQKVDLRMSANMDSDEACHSLVDLVDKSLSLKKVNLTWQEGKRFIGVSVVFARSDTGPGIITCATLKRGEKTKDGNIAIDTVLFQRETKRTNMDIVVVDSSQ